MHTELRTKVLSRLAVGGFNSCWEWQGEIADGYGRVWWESKNKLVHRIMYEWVNGKIPADLQVDHVCCNRRCANPIHLELVTNHENLLRGETKAAANLAKTHCPQGYEYTLENTRVTNGKRHCRTCQRDWWRRNRGAQAKLGEQA
jgi:hypothetical protein